jgi:hypothetical protein
MIGFGACTAHLLCKLLHGGAADLFPGGSRLMKMAEWMLETTVKTGRSAFVS